MNIDERLNKILKLADVIKSMSETSEKDASGQRIRVYDSTLMERFIDKLPELFNNPDEPNKFLAFIEDDELESFDTAKEADEIDGPVPVEPDVANFNARKWATDVMNLKYSDMVPRFNEIWPNMQIDEVLAMKPPVEGCSENIVRLRNGMKGNVSFSPMDHMRSHSRERIIWTD